MQNFKDREIVLSEVRDIVEAKINASASRCNARAFRVQLNRDTWRTSIRYVSNI